MFLMACLPKDAYRMKYDQQDIDYSLTTPLSNTESDHVSEDHLDNPDVNPVYKSSDTHLDKPVRKKKSETLQFYNQDDENFFDQEQEQQKNNINNRKNTL